MIPYGVNGVCFPFKNFDVVLLPYVPYKKSRDELPKSVEDGILIRVIMPVLDGVSNVTLFSISSSA